MFPGVTAGTYFYATLTDSSNNLEIVKVTARTSDIFTVVRAQEGTTARAYAAADKIELRITAASLANMVQLDGAQTITGDKTFSGAVALGTATGTTASPGTSNTQLATTAFVQAAIPALITTIYPVGSIYTSTVSTNPGTLFGVGTWVAYGAGRVLIGQNGTSFVAGATGGSADAIVPVHTHTATLTGTAAATGSEHKHTYKTYGLGNNGLAGNAYTNSDWGYAQTGAPPNTAEGVHTHSVSTTGTTDSAGVSGTNANLPPYVVVYMWQRTA